MADIGTKNLRPDATPTDALKDAGQQLLGLLVQRAAQAATERVTGLADRLTSVSENGGEGLGAALRGNGGNGGNGGGPGLLSRGFGKLKEKVQEAVGGGGSGGQGKKLKMTNIVENLDVGLPLRTTYDLWTQFADFPSFMKKVESVEQASDEKTNWKAQVFLSHRTWEATVVEQVPDSHIVWRSKGPKGHVDGAVTFTELGPNLTRVLLVLEYWPQGLFERTGNLWRAQGRRARLEFKHFRRHAMTNVLIHQEEVEGWRGEIHDSEVVKTHEEALEEERQAADEDVTSGEPEDEDLSAEAAEGAEAGEEISAEEEPEGEAAADEYADEGEDYADEGEDEEYVEDEGYADEGGSDEGGSDEGDSDEGDEYVEEEGEGDGDGADEREPVAARSRRGR
jgi:uncharacterized membrane protein